MKRMALLVRKFIIFFYFQILYYTKLRDKSQKYELINTHRFLYVLLFLCIGTYSLQNLFRQSKKL